MDGFPDDKRREVEKESDAPKNLPRVARGQRTKRHRSGQPEIIPAREREANAPASGNASGLIDCML